MSSFLAFCKTHGFFDVNFFGSRHIIGDVTAIGNVTNCPNCGVTSEILSGTYNFNGEEFNLFLHNDVSLEALGALRNLVERVQRNEVSPEKAKEEAEKITPNAGKWFDFSNWDSSSKAIVLASLISAIGVVAAAKIATNNQNAPIHKTEIIGTFGKSLKNSTALGGIPVPTPRPTKPLKKIR